MLRIAVAGIPLLSQSANHEIGLPEFAAGSLCPETHVEPHSYITEPTRANKRCHLKF